jgi:hypothetical protein
LIYVYRLAGGCSEAAKLDRFWLESSALIPWLGGAESDEGRKAFILKAGGRELWFYSRTGAAIADGFHG